MVSYDLLMLVILLGCTVFGAWKGMAWQLASLGSLVVSYLVALQFSDQLAPAIGTGGPWNRVVAMLILYCCTAIAVWMAFRVVAGMIDRVKLREFDRQLGALFGAAKGVLLCLVITFFAVSLSETAKGMVRQSKSGYYMAVLLGRAHPLIPHDVHEVLDPYFHQLQKGLDPNARPEDQHLLDRPEIFAGDAPGGGLATETSRSLTPWTDDRRDDPWPGPGGSIERPPADRTSRRDNRDAPPTSPSGWDDFRNILDGIRRFNELSRPGDR